MATTYTLIDKVNLGSAQTKIEFASIPSTYTDLLIMYSPRSTASATQDNSVIYFNGITTGYTDLTLIGNGSTAYSFSQSTSPFLWLYMPAASATANTFGNTMIYIPNYTSSNPKSVSFDYVMENNGSTAWSGLTAGIWSYSGNPAINKITLQATSGNLDTYSSAYLYGIKNS